MYPDLEFMYAGQSGVEDDKRLFIRFTIEARLDKRASAETGEVRYKNVEFITIMIPGDKTLTVHRPVQPSDKQRFPLQYAAFKNNQVAGSDLTGTPLSMWIGCTPAQVRELEYFNIHTVEQLAAMPDGVTGSQMMGVNALRNAAKSYVALQKEQAPLQKLQKELDVRDNQLAAQQAQITELSEKLNTLLSDPKRKF